MKYIKIVVFATIIMALVLFAINNQEKVKFVLGYEITLDSITTDETVPVPDEAVTGAVDETGTETSVVEGTESDDTKVETVTTSKGRTIGFERSYKLPLYIILFVEAFVLIILMSLVGIFENFSLRQRIRDLTKETKKQKSELNAIREAAKETEKPIVSKAQKEIKAAEVENTQEKKLLEVNKKEAKKKETKKRKPGLLSKIKKDKAPESKETDEDTNS